MEQEVILRKKNTDSDRCIAKALSISRQSVANIIQKHNIQRPPLKMGRPSKVEQYVKNLIIEKVKNKETRNAATASKLVFSEEGLNITSRHIHNILHKANLKVVRSVRQPKMTVLHKRRRLSWGLSHCGMGIPDWTKVDFSDETKILRIGYGGREIKWVDKYMTVLEVGAIS